MTNYERLLERVYEIQDLRKAVRVLTWDREVNMPVGGDQARANQISTLKKLSHALFTSDEMGELIQAATAELNGVGRRSTEASLIRHLQSDYARARKFPAEFVSEQAYVNSNAITIWKKARAENNFAIYLPWLERIIQIAQEKADLLGYQDERYDALLDIYEPGAKTAQIRHLFYKSKNELKPLYREIGKRRSQVDDSFLRQPYDLVKQQEFAHYLANSVGYDFNRGHLATTVHPFSTSLSRNDVRITTRFNPNFLSSSMFATLHEAGHAMYVQNVDPDLTRTPLAKETSAGLDESQSRMIENIVGRSLGFWRVHFPPLRRLFPDQLGDVSTEQFFLAINKVQPGFIRVDADELTYNMHIILRFELEFALLNNSLQARELPAAWNDKMNEYLGIVPPNDSLGCLQDIHWPMVGFGYFPSYALGNLYAAQFYEAAIQQDPEISDELEQGKTQRLMAWMGKHIHIHGRKFTPGEITRNSTGADLSEAAFVRYANSKFGEVYRISEAIAP